MRRFFSPPDADDVRQYGSARVLYWILVAGIAMSTVKLIAGLAVRDTPAESVGLYVSGVLVCCGSFVLLQLGRPRAAAAVFVSSVWVVGAVTQWLFGPASAAIGGPILAVVMAGFFVGARFAIWVAVASVLWLAVVTHAGASGWLPEPPALSPYRVAASVAVIIALITLTVHLTLRNLRRAVDDAESAAERARESQRAAEESAREQHLAEEARRGLEGELASARRLEALGRLAGGIAHDFNNLLTVILANVGLMKKCTDERGAQRLTEIDEASRRAASMTRQLLTIGGRQVEDVACLSVPAVLQAMEPLLRRLLPEHVQLQLRIDGDVALVRADKSQLEQVVLNLVANARDAMPQGGEIVVETSRIDAGRPSTSVPKHVRAGEYVALIVTDTGGGMDEDTLSSVFEPFFSTKGRKIGTGLGLATVHGIVTKAKGHVWAESELGCGSRFTVLIPAAEALPADAAPAPAATQRGGTPWATGHILLVEDEEDVRAALHAALEASGNTVTSVSHPREALKSSEVLDDIDLLVTDTVMPEMTGPELALRVRERRPELPVLLISGHAESVTPEVLRNRQLSFLHKPFDVATLHERVRGLLQPAGRPHRGGLQ